MTTGHFRQEFILPDQGRPVHNHVGILDVSGSMISSDYLPSRLEAAYAGWLAYLAQIIRRHPASLIATICFSEAACVLCPWTRVDALGDLDMVHADWLETSRAFGLHNTGIGEALQEALPLISQQRGTTQVVLLTDGHQNVGTDPLGVAPQLKSLATVAIVGIGGSPSDVDEELLRQIASTDRYGRPRYRWIGDRDALVAHYEQLAGGLARD